eukprot:Em0020g944a
MLRTAKNTERRHCFNPVDYIVSYLYRHNPLHSNREQIHFEDIWFVAQEWATNPRPPLPLSATLTEDEAAMIIQSFYRAYRVRCWPDVAQLREWQRGFRKEVEAIIKIQRFWRSRKTNS